MILIQMRSLMELIRTDLKVHRILRCESVYFHHLYVSIQTTHS